MTSSSSSSGSLRPSLSLEQFIAFNTELSLLVRSGMPLEAGLREFGRELPGRLETLAETLGKRLAAGEELAHILADPAFGFPPAYHAVVEAGIRSGRLPAALEGIATTARRTADLRRQMFAALIYPLIVLVLAYYFAMFVMVRIAPAFPGYYWRGYQEPPESLRGWEQWGELCMPWGLWLPPLVLLVLGIVGYKRSGAANLTSDAKGWSRVIPTPAAVYRHGAIAHFAELLALLIEHQAPLDRAVELAGAASGHAGLAKTCRENAERLRRGERQLVGLPATLNWMLNSANPSSWLRSLRSAARFRRLRAERLAHWWTVYFPILVTMIVGGLLVLAYCLLLFWPFTRLLYELERG